MNLNTYSNLTQTIKALQQRRFNRTFKLENGKLKCHQTNERYAQQDLQIVEYHRFKNDKNHPEASIIFAIVSNDGKQGYITSSEKNMASRNLLQFMDKVKVRPRKMTNVLRDNKNDMFRPNKQTLR